MKYLISLFFFTIVTVQLHARIIMTPYLQAVTTTTVYVMVECDNHDSVTVNFGLTPEYGLSAKTELIAETDANPVTYVHKIRLPGLLPAAKYYYQATQDKSESQGATFFTAVMPGMPFRMVWMADCRTGTEVFATISRNLLAADPVVALYGGDLCHKSSYKAWKKEFFISDQLNFASQVPFFNAPGNHEGWEQNTRAFTQSPASASGTQDYYSFDYGDLHVICLNTELPCEKGSPQYEFVREDLARNRHQSWKIVMTHAPAYCKGGHGKNEDLVAMTKELFEPGGIDIVFAGHSHFYQHNIVNGIHHMIIGSAGAPLATPKKAAYTLTQAKDYNFAVIDVTSKKIRVVVYNAEKVVLDSLELSK
jgi:acid phosphatase type 7